MTSQPIVGTEWLVEARGCDEGVLRDEAALRGVFSAVIGDLGLKPIGKGVWYGFPEEGGITGLVALTESHLACHTYPEYGIATFNLYCCKARPAWDWAEKLKLHLNANEVDVTAIERGNRQMAGSAGGGI